MIKKLIMRIRERIYFKEIFEMKMNNRPLIITTTSDVIKQDKNSYHEYYLKYKKVV